MDADSHNIFDIQRRTEEFFTYFKGYLHQARTWEEILKNCDIKNIECVIDLCPGWAPKIEWALYHLNYSGKVIAYDESPEATKNITEFMQLFPIKYQLQTVAGKLELPTIEPAKIVIANHIIDDFILNHFSRLWGESAKDVYRSEKAYIQMVGRILAEKEECEKCLDEFARALSLYVAADGLLFITHYPSVTERSLHLAEWSGFCARFLEKTGQRLANIHFEETSAFYRKQLAANDNPYFSQESLIVMRCAASL